MTMLKKSAGMAYSYGITWKGIILYALHLHGFTLSCRPEQTPEIILQQPHSFHADIPDATVPQ